MPGLLVCRVTWMSRYQGIAGGADSPRGGGRFVEQHGYGYEIYNFLRHKGRVYGYVQVPGGGQDIDIDRLGATADADRVHGVLIVWAARHPKGGVFVLGWYKNATVFRSPQTGGVDRRRRRPDQLRLLCPWNITAPASSVHLLEESRRTFRLPVGENMLGASLITYLDGAHSTQRRLRQQLLAYVKADAKLPVHRARHSHRGGWSTDPGRRREVEEAAIAHTMKCYYDDGYDGVESVEQERCGWDLEAQSGDRMVRVEVKGTMGRDIWAELTPNELTQMQKYRGEYHLCVVTQALARQHRQLRRFTWVEERGAWCDLEGRQLLVEHKTGAVVRVA